ncbi:MAG: hypothetical protein HYY28_00235 [Betaproteobacteria bacterium]|nr:hypothetical protein [Betaproteobacteria bacterium]MBI2958714.1 hypothetical protein [Betaproteobacteria bacterium]
MQDTSSASRGLRQRWEDYQTSKTQTFWIAVGGIVATLILGFGPGGWVTGGTAQKMIAEAAANSRHELAAVVCVEDFMGAADASSRLKKIKKARWYERDEMIASGGWATMPDRKEPNSVVASMCASRLETLEAPQAGTPQAGEVSRTSTTPAK